jgi:hypothetical protein
MVTLLHSHGGPIPAFPFHHPIGGKWMYLSSGQSSPLAGPTGSTCWAIFTWTVQLKLYHYSSLHDPHYFHLFTVLVVVVVKLMMSHRALYLHPPPPIYHVPLFSHFTPQKTIYFFAFFPSHTHFFSTNGPVPSLPQLFPTVHCTFLTWLTLLVWRC